MVPANKSPTPAISTKVWALLRSVWQGRGFFGGLLAIALASVGQWNLIINARKPGVNDADASLVSAICYASAIIVLIASLFHLRSRWQLQVGQDIERGEWIESGDIRLNPLSSFRAWRVRAGKRVTLVGMALTLGLGTASIFVLIADNSNPIGGWLWVAALVVLVLTFLGLDESWPRGEGLLPGPRDDVFGAGVPVMSRRLEIVCIIAILLVSLILRLYDLNDYPFIAGDEGARGLDARAILEGNRANIFGFGWLGVPNLYFYLVAAMFSLFGDSLFSARILSVVSGLLAIWFVYRIGKLLWGPRAGLIAGALLGVSSLALQFSRSAGESTPTGALWAAGCFYLFMALRYRRWNDWVLCGIWCGLNFYFYASGRFIVVVLALVALYCLARWRMKFIKLYALGFALMAFALVLTVMPNLTNVFTAEKGWQEFSERTQETSIFAIGNQMAVFSERDVPYDPAWANEPVLNSVLRHPLAWGQVLFGQVSRTLDTLYRRQGGSGFYVIEEHNGSMLPPLWAALALLGLAYAAWKMWDARFGVCNVWFWGGLLVVVFTTNTPSVQRLINSWPVLMIFPAALVDRIFAAAWPISPSLARRWASVPLIVMLLYFGADEANTYFVNHAAVSDQFWHTYTRYIKTLGQDYKVYQLSNGDKIASFHYESVRFAAKEIEGDNVVVPASDLPITDKSDKGAAFVLPLWNAHYLSLLKTLYPGGVTDEVQGRDGQRYFLAYKLPRERFTNTHTLRVSYVGSDGRYIRRNEPGIGTEQGSGEWTPPAGLKYPVQAIWEGGLVAPAYITCTLELSGTIDVSLDVDSEVRARGRSSAGAGIVLEKGLHHVKLTSMFENESDHVAVRCEVPGVGINVVPDHYLFNGLVGGLSAEIAQGIGTATLKAPDPLAGMVVSERRMYSTVGFPDAVAEFGERPFRVRFRGTLEVPSDGEYTFDLLCNGHVVLMIDGKVVSDNVSPTPATGNSNANNSVEGKVKLVAGQHTVDLRYAWEEGPSRLEWLWTQPGAKPESTEIVPMNVLKP